MLSYLRQNKIISRQILAENRIGDRAELLEGWKARWKCLNFHLIESRKRDRGIHTGGECWDRYLMNVYAAVIG